MLAGNFDGLPPELGGRMSASYGLILRGDGHGNFTPLDVSRSGFFVPGETRDIQRVSSARYGTLYVVARNNDRPLVFRATKQQAVASGSATRAPRRATAASSR